MLRVLVNGRPHEAREGTTVLDAVRALGTRVPTLCHDDRLKPYGGCRLCLVEIAGEERPAAACTTPVTDGMAIATHTPEIEAHRRALLALLARDYPAASYRRDPDKELHRYFREYGLEGALRGSLDPGLLDDSHPYLRVDMSQCVYCYRCVRICDELQGQFVWRVWERGDRTRIRPDGPNLLQSSCVSCGACADTCPSGAIDDRLAGERGAATAWTRTTCPYCGTGCELSAGTRGGTVVAVRPVPDAPVGKGHLCVKGRYAFGFVSAPDRLTAPLIRDGAGWRSASWDEAIAFVAARLRALRDRHGADSLAVLGSARATNEENYLAQKLARVALGTNNVDCCARVCHAPSAAGLKEMLGAGAATNSFDDIERARTIMVFGANPTENHPIVGARIKQAAIAGAHLVVIDPRRIELAEYAECHLAPRPGTNIPLLNAMACTVVEEGLSDREFLAARVEGYEEYREWILRWPAERVSEVTGVDAGLIRRAARLYGGERPAMSVHGLGLTEHTQGSEAVMALINLALLTGNLGKPGCGVNPLRGQNNVQGAAHMGCDPALLPGSLPLAAGRELCEQVWGAPVPRQPGLRLPVMMEAALAGRLKALWAIGYDVLLTNPNATETRRSLAALDLLVVQDMFLNETARELAHVVLPACSSFEKDGTFMNGERRIQRVRKAIAPLGGSRSDWEILCDVARALGHGDAFEFSGPEAIWDEVRAVWPDGRGISYDRLERGGLRWPCPSEDHPGTDILHRDGFGVGPRARLRAIDDRPTPEATDAEYPFLLTTGRTLHQFNAGTMTARTPNAVLRPADLLEMAPADADALSLADGERVRVLSRYGAAEILLSKSDRMKPGELFATFHTAATFLNRVTGPYRDRIADTPEYKVTAVRIERALESRSG
jgi:formate dehydrogenase major subunit